MNPELLKNLLTNVKEGNLSVAEALSRLRHLPFEELEDATIDHHREMRRGFPEAVLGEGKSTGQIANIVRSMKEKESNILITRLSEEKAATLKKEFPLFNYHPVARAGTLLATEIKKEGKGIVLVVSAGTSDLPVAEEAALTAELLGNDVERLWDVGVAGVHRLLAKKDRLTAARVLIVVAGMEGALPSVVAGLVSKPVVAVPTSVGYGASFQGVTALLSMLNSCVPGVLVVNIDNGYGAGCAASMINRL